MLPHPSLLYNRINRHGLFFAEDDDLFKLQNIHNVVLNATCALAVESVQVTNLKPRGVKAQKREVPVATSQAGFSLQSN